MNAINTIEVVTRPEWLRLPKPGTRCPYTGLTRTTLDQLTRPQVLNKFDPVVESKIIQHAGYPKGGVRVISYASLMSFLEKLPSDKGRAKQEQPARPTRRRVGMARK
jgi:hypothetical protein